MAAPQSWRAAAASLKLQPVEPPDVQYAGSGDLSIAYQVVGEGPIDLVFVPFIISPIFSWIHPLFASFYERLASFSRLILFDKRGIGASDRPRTPPTLEAQMDDVRAVLDALGSEQAALFGSGHGGQMCSLFAATYPERTSALIIYDPFARLPGTREEHQRTIRRLRNEWGRRETLERILKKDYPSLAGDESFLRAMAIILRASASPGSAAEFSRTVAEADITDVLPTIRVGRYCSTGGFSTTRSQCSKRWGFTTPRTKSGRSRRLSPTHGRLRSPVATPRRSSATRSRPR
jgi:pimeloyl-ACP methyl ester carboxylesterase